MQHCKFRHSRRADVEAKTITLELQLGDGGLQTPCTAAAGMPAAGHAQRERSSAACEPPCAAAGRHFSDGSARAGSCTTVISHFTGNIGAAAGAHLERRGAWPGHGQPYPGPEHPCCATLHRWRRANEARPHREGRPAHQQHALPNQGWSRKNGNTGEQHLVGIWADPLHGAARNQTRYQLDPVSENYIQESPASPAAATLSSKLLTVRGGSPTAQPLAATASTERT